MVEPKSTEEGQSSLLCVRMAAQPQLIHFWERKNKPLEEKSWSEKFPCAQACEEADDNSGGISIHNIGGVFIVIFIGIGLAIVTLAAEYWSIPFPPFLPVPFSWGLDWLISHGVWFLLVLSRYYKYKAPSTRVSSVEVRTNKQIFFGREDVSEYFATLFPPLRSRRERRKTTEHLSSGITRKTFLESKTRLEVLKFLRNRSFEIS